MRSWLPNEGQIGAIAYWLLMTILLYMFVPLHYDRSNSWISPRVIVHQFPSTKIVSNKNDIICDELSNSPLSKCVFHEMYGKLLLSYKEIYMIFFSTFEQEKNLMV